MSRYIDAEEFVEDLKVEFSNLMFDGLKGTPRPRELSFSQIVERVECVPTADVVSVVHGKWVRCGRLESKIVMKCSECEQGITSMFAPVYHYCPNCGAKMDGGTSCE